MEAISHYSGRELTDTQSVSVFSKVLCAQYHGLRTAVVAEVARPLLRA